MQAPELILISTPTDESATRHMAIAPLAEQPKASAGKACELAARRSGLRRLLACRRLGFVANEAGSAEPILANEPSSAGEASFTMAVNPENTENPSALARILLAAKLAEKLHSIGDCTSCGSAGVWLGGYGVYCVPCNKRWCDKYADDGTMLTAEELRALKPGSRPKTYEAKINIPSVRKVEASLGWVAFSNQSLLEVFFLIADSNQKNSRS